MKPMYWGAIVVVVVLIILYFVYKNWKTGKTPATAAASSVAAASVAFPVYATLANGTVIYENENSPTDLSDANGNPLNPDGSVYTP